MKPDFSIVVPAYNEIESLPSLRAAIDEYIEQAPMSLQFVLVDDGSIDDTFGVLSTWSLKGARLKIVKLSKNFGSHAAIRAGIFHADADRVMVYSSDMPEPLSDATLFYEGLQSGVELVYSVRKDYKGDLGSRIFSKLINRCIDKNYPTEGLICVAFGAKIKHELNSDIESNSSFFFQLFQLGFERLGVPVSYNDRVIGVSKWTFAKKIKLFIDSFVMFSFVPIRAISGMGVVLSAIGVVWALAIIIARLFNLLEFEAGWPTLLSILLIGFGVTNLSLGVIAEYLVRTLDAARGKKTFVTDCVIVKPGDGAL
ncbi:MAG: glycosyltransferase [Coriobacteriia bacterium]|nr:glycosyltransferase [Coriobacteriia bacterium]